MHADDGVPGIDLEIARRADRSVRRKLQQPEGLASKLDECSRQFQLWEVDRMEVEPERPRLERLPRIEPLAGLGGGFQRVLAECTREVSSLELLSRQAAEGFRGYRAARSKALREPYPYARPDE